MRSDSSRRVVVVGNGMAGCRFVQEILERDLDRRLALTVIGDEPGGAYNRMQLSNVLAGVARAQDLVLAGEDWYAAQGVTLRPGVRVEGIDRSGKQVRLGDGTVLPYDVLVLATGSSALMPPIDGLRTDRDRLRPGAVAFRTLADCQMIDRSANRAQAAVVLGAGVLGLEAARGLAGRGVPVTLVQRGSRLMERQLDAGASRVLSRTAGSLGVQLRTGSGVRGVRGDDRVRALILDDGSEVPADLLVLCCGVRPRAELARGAGLAVNVGVVVDDHLRSVTDPDVFAIGECAEHRGQTYALVAPVWEQARVAAAVIAQPEQPVQYHGSRTVVRLKATGIELASLGDPTDTAEDDGDDDGAEVICFSDRARGVYQKLVVRDGRLTGAILLGDTRTVGTLTQLFDRGALLPADRASLLMVRRNAPATTAESPTALPGRTTICQCNGVTKTGICTAWEDGARTVSEVAARTRATTGCGSCRDTVEGLLDWLTAADTESREPTSEPSSGPSRRATAGVGADPRA
jgi:assimilatory nitrate reductase electron transfer subunit